MRIFLTFTLTLTLALSACAGHADGCDLELVTIPEPFELPDDLAEALEAVGE